MKKSSAFGVTAMVAVVALLSFLLSPSAVRQAQAQISGASYVITAPAGSDPCQNASIAKSSAPVAITSSTTTELVAAAAGKKIYVCRFVGTLVGTTPTIKFQTGTKVSTACDTGAADLSGALAIATTTLINFGGAESLVSGATAGELCLVTGGTVTGMNGFVTYVAQNQ